MKVIEWDENVPLRKFSQKFTLIEAKFGPTNTNFPIF